MPSPTETRISVDSSLLKSVRYSADATLEIELRHGATYRYFLVPHRVYEELMAAESKGDYFNHHVKPRFRCERIE